MKFKFLEHTADIKFQAFGKSPEELFENCFLALKKSICGNLNVKTNLARKIKIKGKDNESLLYNFLEEFLFLLDSEDFLLSKIKNMKIKDNKLSAEVFGDDAGNYEFTNDVKAITFSQMKIKKEKGKWVAQVVLDV